MEADLLILGILVARADLVTLDTYAGGGRDYLGVEEIHRLANEGRSESDEITIDRVNVALADLRAAGVILETQHAREPDPHNPGHFRAFGNSRRRLSPWIFARMGKRVWKTFRGLSEFFESKRGKRGWRAVAFRPHRWVGGSENRKSSPRRAAVDLATAKNFESADWTATGSNRFDQPAARRKPAQLDRHALLEEFATTGRPESEFFAWLARRKKTSE